MPASEELKALVDKMPSPDSHGMFSDVYDLPRAREQKKEPKGPPDPEKEKQDRETAKIMMGELGALRTAILAQSGKEAADTAKAQLEAFRKKYPSDAAATETDRIWSQVVARAQGMDKERIEGAIADIQKMGRDGVLGLIDLLVPPGQGDDVKPHYALHALAIAVCKIEDKEPRRTFSEAVASQLGGPRPKAVQAYLCQELGVAGGKEVVPPLGKLLTDEELCDWAIRSLVAIGDGAAEQLRTALPNATGKCRLAIIQNLGVVKDEKSVDALKAAVADPDREIRLAALWGLANIGDPGSVDLLLKAAGVEPGWERIQATKACLMLAESLLASNRKDDAVKIYTQLRDTRTDPSEKYVKDAAEKALAAAK